MVYPIALDIQVPGNVRDITFYVILAVGLVVGVAYLVWLLACRGPGCKQYPNHPVWLQQLMDRDFLVFDLYALQAFEIIYAMAALYLADIIYRLLAMAGVVRLVD